MTDNSTKGAEPHQNDNLLQQRFIPARSAAMQGIRAFHLFIGSAFDDAGLDPFEFRVLCHIARCTDESRRCFESIKTIAEHCRFGERRVHMALKTL